MKRSLRYILIVLSLIVGHAAQAQWIQIASSLPSSIGAYYYGSYSIGAGAFSPGGGGASFPDPTGTGCLGPTGILGGPAGTMQYAIGTGGGAAKIFFVSNKAIYKIRVKFDNLNQGEDFGVRVYTGAGAPYYIKPTQPCLSLTTACKGTLSNACTIDPLTGVIQGPACCVSGAATPFNGGEFCLDTCKGFTYWEVFMNNSINGCNFTMFFDSTKNPACSDAIANDPCELDTLKLGVIGDSTGATYVWTGPLAYSSTDQYPFIYPAYPAMSGTYRVIKTVGTTHDTDTVSVVVHPRPKVSPANNSPLCENPLDTLHLWDLGTTVTSETWSWTGPNTFTSTLQNPDIYGFLAVDTGTYKVVVTTPFGCSDSGTTYVSMRLPPLPPKIIGPSPYCFGDPFIPFKTTGVPGATILWYTASYGGVGVTAAPSINTSVAGSTWVFASQREGLYCESARDSLQIVVKPEIKPSFNWSTLLGCDQDVVTFNNTSTNADWYSWVYGDGNYSGDTTTKLITQNLYKKHKVFKVILIGYTPGCSDSAVGYVNTTHSIKAAFSPWPNEICAGGWTTMNDSFTMVVDSTLVTQPDGPIAALTGSSSTVDTILHYTDTLANTYLAASYEWYWGDGTSDLTNTRKPAVHRYDSGGVYYIKLKVTDSVGCVDTITKELRVIKLTLKSFADTMLCISQPLPMKNVLDPNYDESNYAGTYTYSWTPSTYLSDSTVQSPLFDVGSQVTDAIITYTATATLPALGCYTYDTIRVHAVKPVKLANVSTSTTILYGRSIQLNSDSEVYYYWKRDNGTLDNPNINNPVATPLETTTYAIYGYDKNGCVDSAFVTIRVDSTMIEDIPSAFTPNGDGLNDYFRPVGMKYQNIVDFRVYNRIGQQVFYTNTNKVGWDGMFNGVPQDLGTYFYVITVARPGGDGDNVTYKGTVTLIR